LRSRLFLSAVLVLLLFELPFFVSTFVPTTDAQAQNVWTASFGVSGFSSTTGVNYSVIGHFSFTLSNLSGSAGIYFLSATLGVQCAGKFTYNNTVAYQATYNSGTNQLSFRKLSAGLPSSGYVAYSCSVGTGGAYNNYMNETPFNANAFNITLANGATVPISGTSYFGSAAGTIVLLSGTSVVTSFTSTSSSATSSTSTSFTLNTNTTSSPTSSSTSSSGSTGGGGIPEFPYQTTAVVVFTVLIIAVYLLVRRNERSS
jgi:hypothetical protein